MHFDWHYDSSKIRSIVLELKYADGNTHSECRLFKSNLFLRMRMKLAMKRLARRYDKISDAMIWAGEHLLF